MKKIYISILALSLTFPLLSQNLLTIDFENHLSTPETFDNGSDLGGNFVFDILSLSNNYNTSWGSWIGFSISNITDNTTAGWGNQYASFTGSGDLSESYALCFETGEITLHAPGKIDSFFVTNTAYAAINMRDGDAYSKQFGSIYNADGVEDGTNGEDFLRLWVIVENEISQEKDSIEFYLADFRFADNQEDYILDEWAKIDLTTFSFDVTKVNFYFESSDMGQFGINTPTFFAIDNISTDYYEGLNEAQLDVTVYPNPVNDRLILKGEIGQIQLMDAKGNVLEVLMHDLLTSIDFSLYASGVYFVLLTNDKGSFSTKIVK